MTCELLKVFAFVLLTSYSPHRSARGSTPEPSPPVISADEQERISLGLDLGKAIADEIGKGNFVTSLEKLGNNLGGFLGVLGPLASIAFSFIPTEDSEEMEFLKEKFAQVNNKLDVITSEFEEIKNAIEWAGVTITYGVYELKIKAAESNLNRIYEVEGEAREAEKNNFIIQYENDFENSHLKLYNGIVSSDQVLSTNIMEAVVRQTKNHKTKVEQFSLGLIQLLIRGITVMISYYGIKEWPTETVMADWNTKITTLNEELQRVSNEVKSRYLTQLRTDAEDIINRHYELNNEELMRTLYSFIIDKYDWRYWFVAVYNDIDGLDRHNISTQCGGAYILHKHNKNTVISSQDNSYLTEFSQNDADNLVQSVVQDIDDCLLALPGRKRAEALVKRARGKVRTSCRPNALYLAVEIPAEFESSNINGHRAMRRISKRMSCNCRTIPRIGHRYCDTATWNHNLYVFG